MNTLLTSYLFVLGTAFGSFAGAVAWRLEKRRDIVRERSECEHCHHRLAWYDLVPVVSWLGLKGRCRYCRKSIGVSALLLELGVGGAFMASFAVWPYGFTALGIALFVSWLAALVGLAILFVYDFRHYLLPDVIVWPLAGLGAAIFVQKQLLIGTAPAAWLPEAVLALLPVTGVYGLLYQISNGKLIGFGDVKLGIFIGFALGWQGALLALLLANYLGFFWVLPSLLSGGLKKGSRMPFGPFLIAATVITFLWGGTLIGWVTSFLLL